MPVTAIAAVATVGSAVISSNATSKAAKTEANAVNSANDTQKQIYDQTQTNNAPWKDVGTQALGQLSKLYGIQTHDINGNVTGGAATAGTPDMSGFTTSPDYQFRLQQGDKNVNASYAAKGSLESGAAQKALVDYGQASASQEYGNYFNRLATLAGYGTQANTADANAGTNFANTTGANTINGANTQANLTIGNANATNAALGQVTGILSSGSWAPKTPTTPAITTPKAAMTNQPAPVLL